MTNGDRQFEFVGQLLEFNLPQTHTVAVTPAGVSGNQQSVGFGIPFSPHNLPPSADGIHGKGGGVMICPNAYPSSVIADVINTIRNSTLQLGIDEIVNINLFWVAFGAPFAP